MKNIMKIEQKLEPKSAKQDCTQPQLTTGHLQTLAYPQAIAEQPEHELATSKSLGQNLRRGNASASTIARFR